MIEKLISFLEKNPNLQQDAIEIFAESRKISSLLLEKDDGVNILQKKKNEIYLAEIKRINKIFADNALQIVYVKGLVNAICLYDNIGIRKQVDIDAIVPFEQREQALKLLVESGYAYDEIEYFHKEFASQKYYVNFCDLSKKYDSDILPEIALDLHFFSTENVEHNAFKHIRTINYNDVDIHALNVYEDLLWQIEHFCFDYFSDFLELIKGRFVRPVFPKLRSLHDIALILNQHSKSINWNILKSKIQNSNLYIRVKFCFNMINHIYGAIIPESFLLWLNSSDIIESQKIINYYDNCLISLNDTPINDLIFCNSLYETKILMHKIRRNKQKMKCTRLEGLRHDTSVAVLLDELSSEYKNAYGTYYKDGTLPTKANNIRATVNSCWNESHVYFTFDIEYSSIVLRSPAESINAFGPKIDIILNTFLNGSDVSEGSKKHHQFRCFLCEDSDDIPIRFINHKKEYFLDDTRDFILSFEHKDNEYHFKIGIPWSRLSIIPQKGMSIAFDFVIWHVYNDTAATAYSWSNPTEHKFNMLEYGDLILA